MSASTTTPVSPQAPSSVTTAVPPVSPQLAFTAALVVMGLSAFLAQTLWVTDFVTGMIMGSVGTAGLVIAAVRVPASPGQVLLPNAGAAVFLVLGMLNLCAGSCGSFMGYERVAGIPIAIPGLLYHCAMSGFGVVLGRGVIARQWDGVIPMASVLGIGSSLFYLSIMVAYQHWCGSCLAAHGLMVVQAVQLVRWIGWRQAVLPGVSVVACAGIINAVFHHRPHDHVENDPTALLAYLRTERSGAVPLARFAVRHTDRAMGASAEHGTPAVGEDRTDTAAVVDGASGDRIMATGDGFRSARSIGSWGASSAPVVLRVAEDPTCPHCLRSIRELFQLTDMVTAGQVRIEFDIIYRTTPTICQRGQAAAYAMYAAGYLGEQPFIDTVRSVFEGIAGVQDFARIATLLPSSLDTAQWRSALTGRRDEIEDRLKDNFIMLRRHGAGGTPFYAFFAGTDTEPRMTFVGHRDHAALRYVVEALQP